MMGCQGSGNVGQGSQQHRAGMPGSKKTERQGELKQCSRFLTIVPGLMTVSTVILRKSRRPYMTIQVRQVHLQRHTLILSHVGVEEP